MRNARDILAEAQAALADKSAHLAGLRETRERAREFAAEQARAVEQLAGEAHDIACERSDAIKAALKAGATPLFPEVLALPANAARMADAQNRLASARLALEELQAEEAQAEAAVTKARNEVASAITMLVADEANALAVEVEELEAAALLLRARLGRPIGVVGQLRTGLSPAVGRVMSSNERLEAVMLTPAGRSLSIEATNASRVWAAFAEALEGDADAELSFEGPATDEASRAA